VGDTGKDRLSNLKDMGSDKRTRRRNHRRRELRFINKSESRARSAQPDRGGRNRSPALHLLRKDDVNDTLRWSSGNFDFKQHLLFEFAVESAHFMKKNRNLSPDLRKLRANSGFCSLVGLLPNIVRCSCD
jgi:hypothetical protein